MGKAGRQVNGVRRGMQEPRPAFVEAVQHERRNRQSRQHTRVESKLDPACIQQAGSRPGSMHCSTSPERRSKPGRGDVLLALWMLVEGVGECLGRVTGEHLDGVTDNGPFTRGNRTRRAHPGLQLPV